MGTFLRSTRGHVTGSVITDAKDRYYRQTYVWQESDANSLTVRRSDGNGDEFGLAKDVPLDESLIAFFGLYSGDGAKGTEDQKDPKRIIPNISFSQKEAHLVRFAVDQFRKLFPGNIRFTFSLGEDSAYFMAGPGKAQLDDYYRGRGLAGTPPTSPLASFAARLSDKDREYLEELRPDVPGSNEDHLAFYYTHKAAMEAIFTALKTEELIAVGIDPISPDVRVTASLRRPFKKGAREPGGSSRSDEIHIGGLNGAGELFLKMLHEIEDSVLRNSQRSSSGLVEWTGAPSDSGELLDLYDFFSTNSYGIIDKKRPRKLTKNNGHVIGQWQRSSETTLLRYLRIDPLWCYTSGLYLAEGTTEKSKLFKMFSESPGSLGLGFTSSEGTSIELMLRTLHKLFPIDKCLDAWKVKVGSQYFPELVVTGLKHGVPMLRGGSSGDGKLRTMEISLAIKNWALDVADAPLNGTESLLRQHYALRYSHVEPTGSGVARIDFWASSTLCRWYFPLLMYTVFGKLFNDPAEGFY